MKHIASLIICAFLTVGLVNAQEAAYRFEKGKEYKYLIEQTNLTLQEIPGQTVTTSTEVTMNVVYTLLEVLENGNLKMQATIEMRWRSMKDPRACSQSVRIWRAKASSTK
jgi:hypothetical protein